MYIERISQEENGFTAVRIGGIVVNGAGEKDGASDLYRHGIELSRKAETHLPIGFLSYVLREPGVMVYRAPSESYELKEHDLLSAVHRTLCEAYGGQPLTYHNSDDQLTMWMSSGNIHEVDLAV